MKYLFLFLFYFIHFVYAIDTLPKHNTINIGILSFRDIDENQKAWKPLEDYLNNHNKTYQFKIHSYIQDDLEKAVAKNELDIIFVYPLVSVAMETKYHTHNIASIVRKDSDGKLLNSYGSTIIVRASRDDINSLKDLKDKTIAIPVKTGFVTYLIPKEMLN